MATREERNKIKEHEKKIIRKLLKQGVTQTTMAKRLGISRFAVADRIKEIKAEDG